jgi:hypothetical protein
MKSNSRTGGAPPPKQSSSKQASNANDEEQLIISSSNRYSSPECMHSSLHSSAPSSIVATTCPTTSPGHRHSISQCYHFDATHVDGLSTSTSLFPSNQSPSLKDNYSIVRFVTESISPLYSNTYASAEGSIQAHITTMKAHLDALDAVFYQE